MKIKQTTIETVNQYLVEIISSYVDLKKRGSLYVGFSPFNSEKTPSFTVSPSKGIWKDFSSGKGGKGPISFIMEYESLTFPDAVKRGADILKVEVEYEDSDEDEMFYSNAIDTLQYFFKKNLNERIKQYIYSRGINDSSIEKFGIGYAPAYKDVLNFMLNTSYVKEYLKLKILGYDKEKNEYYPKFYNRLMFPIFNKFGTIVGFSGRDITGKSKSKYVNSPESEYFKKRNILYGLNFVDKKRKKIVLVEGQIDVILLHQAGFDIAVASQGTAFTKMQLNHIKDKKILICYDGDKAGYNAAYKATNIMLQNGVIPKVTFLKDNDPADIVSQYGINEFLRRIKNNMSGTAFVVEYLISGNTEKKIKGLDELKSTIDKYPYPIQEEIIERYIAKTNGDVSIFKQQKPSNITIEECMVIKYCLINGLKKEIEKLSTLTGMDINEKMIKKLECDIIGDEEFDEMYEGVIESLKLKKINQIKQSSMSYSDKKTLINQIRSI